MFNYDNLVNEMDGLKGFAWRLTQNTHDAEDLVQSTMLRAMEKQHLFQEDSCLFKWTCKIMYNQFASAYRRRVKFESQYDPQPYIDRQYKPAEQFEKAELLQALSAMEFLSDEHREIYHMICIQEMRYKEVAEKLGIPLGTVRSRLSRARESLKHIMNNKRMSQGNSIH